MTVLPQAGAYQHGKRNCRFFCSKNPPFIEKNGMKLIYHTDNELLEVYNSFSKIENSLPSNFVRCHKSFIANINNISSISLADGTILFKNNETCYIGPKYKDSFMEVIDYDTSLK